MTLRKKKDETTPNTETYPFYKNKIIFARHTMSAPYSYTGRNDGGWRIKQIYNQLHNIIQVVDL